MVKFLNNNQIKYIRSVSISFSADGFTSHDLNKESFLVNKAHGLSGSNHNLDGRCGTNRFFQVLGNIHDIEAYFGVDNTFALNTSIFLCHWGHLAIIFIWIASIHFHVGANGNYQLWTQNPINTIPIAHAVFDPHFALSEITNNIAHSGIYNVLYTLGFSSVSQIYNVVIGCELLALASIGLAFIHLIYLDASLPVDMLPSTVYFDLGGQRLNFHTGVLVGFTSIAWAGHLVHVAIPVSKGVAFKSDVAHADHNFHATSYTGNWAYDIASMDKDENIFGTPAHAGSSVITFFGGLKPDTMSLYLTDIAHHHLAIGVLFVLLSHVYASMYKAFRFPGASTPWAAALQNSLHLQLSLACTALSVITSAVAAQVSLSTPYVYLSYDYVTTTALYVHHQYIAAFLMMGGMSHAAIYIINSGNINKMKAQLISHLSWVCLFLGFHTLGIYIHNDTVSAFGQASSQILIEPVLTTGDLLLHHAIALGLHVTTLILLKGSLDATGSNLMPDKLHFSLGFACDGPTRGGTCDISAFDSIYLAFFWMLNTHAWLAFYFHWKHL